MLVWAFFNVGLGFFLMLVWGFLGGGRGVL